MTNGVEGGGGGNATDGGFGRAATSIGSHVLGGLAQTNFEPLMGGCQGGEVIGGGGGGGALQLDSFDTIHIDSTAIIGLGGAGGVNGFGGGAGGTTVFEAPAIQIYGGVATNGGAGGLGGQSCNGVGADATNDAVPAAGATCDGSVGVAGGDGGTAFAVPGDGSIHGGGGGSVGRILIRSEDGTFTGPGPLFSVVATMDTLLKI